LQILNIMRVRRPQTRETAYESKDLVLGYQLLLMKSQNETKKLVLSPAHPKVRLDAKDRDSGAQTNIEFRMGEDMSLELVQSGLLEVPAFLNGKALSGDRRSLEHGHVIQVGDEIIKIQRLQTKIGRKGLATQVVYSSDRRLQNRELGRNRWHFVQGFIALTIVGSILLLKHFSQ